MFVYVVRLVYVPFVCSCNLTPPWLSYLAGFFLPQNLQVLGYVDIIYSVSILVEGTNIRYRRQPMTKLKSLD